MPGQLAATLKNPFKFKLFLLRKLPMALMAGLKLIELDERKASVAVRYGYFTQNPFRSLYFACQSMAGELASGVLSILQVEAAGVPVSMLVVRIEADFTKKATGKVIFTCNDGAKIKEAIQQSIQTGSGVTLVATSIGLDEAGDKVCEFKVTWSYKAKKK